MADNKKIVEMNETTAETATGRIIELGKSYTFEGKEYKSVDMNGLDKLTIQDAIDAQRQLFNEQEVATAMLCETTTAFARALAAKATGLPIEFFKLLPRGASRRVTAAVREYMSVESRTENHVVTFEKPYTFKGETVTEVDLNGIADLNSMNESEAENRLARAGFVITETSFNYLFACVLASMATGKPEEFYTGLPLYELLKLKNAVNDAGFFE
ncbi:MAG: phage tail assembly protein [Muribaculaceae bacterium]|nr:phage tail assembly protein [Muribaculaceae bacterium]MCM1439335.1 phage tail assembly protein [Roseburia sp.]